MPPNYDKEIQELKLLAASFQTQLAQHKLEDEKRFGEISERVARVESVLPTLATHDDLQGMENRISRIIEKGVQVAGIDMSIVQTDLDWLKRWFWVMIGFALGVGSALIAHLFGKI